MELKSIHLLNIFIILFLALTIIFGITNTVINYAALDVLDDQSFTAGILTLIPTRTPTPTPKLVTLPSVNETCVGEGLNFWCSDAKRNAQKDLKYCLQKALDKCNATGGSNKLGACSTTKGDQGGICYYKMACNYECYY